MVRRTAQVTLAGGALLLCALATLAVARRPGPPLAAGSTLPPALVRPGAPDEVVLAWVFRTGDYLSCAAPIAELRRAQHALGPKVRVAAVVVGARHRGWVPAYFRRERVSAEVAYLDVDEYRRVLGASPLPALYLVRGGTIRNVLFAGHAQSRAAPRLAAIGPLVRASLQRAGSPPLGSGSAH